MKILFFIFFGLLFFGCTCESTQLENLEAEQIKLEQKIDSLQSQIKQLEELVLTHDEIISGMLEAKPGSLLHELENQ
jgi:peptidoglycan hydrolase CwlO-like protein